MNEQIVAILKRRIEQKRGEMAALEAYVNGLEDAVDILSPPDQKIKIQANEPILPPNWGSLGVPEDER